MTLDLTGIDQEEAWSVSSILPPGRHLCRFTEAVEGKSTNNFDELRLRLEAVSGPSAGSSIGVKQVVVPASLGKVRQILEAAGIDVNGLDQFDPSTLIGRQVLVVVGQEPGRTDSTRMFSVVTGFLPADASNGGGPDGVAPDTQDADADIPF